MMSAYKAHRPRAALVCGFLSAHDARIAKQAHALRDAGWDVDVLSWQHVDGPYPTLPDAQLLDWQSSLIDLGYRKWPLLAQNLARAARQRHVLTKALLRGHYDAVISSDPETLRPCAQAKAKGSYRLIYDAHEYFPDEVPDDPARSAWVQKVHAMAAPHLDAFITVNEAIAQLYYQETPQMGVPIVVQNASPRRDIVQDDGRLRALAGVGMDQKIVLFQGGLARDRGLLALVEAMSQAPKDWALVMMGSGPLLPALRAKAGPNTHFIPPQDWQELHLWTAGADLGALLYEGTCANQRLCSPNKLWEYPAAGLPILATNLPYLGPMVAKHGLGFVIPEPVTAPAIVATLEQLSPDALAQARSGAATFTAAHSWENQAARFVHTVRQAGTQAETGDPPAPPIPEWP